MVVLCRKELRGGRSVGQAVWPNSKNSTLCQLALHQLCQPELAHFSKDLELCHHDAPYFVPVRQSRSGSTVSTASASMRFPQEAAWATYPPPQGASRHAPVAQLDRAFASEAIGQKFESSRVRSKKGRPVGRPFLLRTPRSWRFP